MFQAVDIPYRRWRRVRYSMKLQLVQTMESRRLIKAMQRDLSAGRAVDMRHEIVNESQPDIRGESRYQIDAKSRLSPRYVYDTISITITD